MQDAVSNKAQTHLKNDISQVATQLDLAVLIASLLNENHYHCLSPGEMKQEDDVIYADMMEYESILTSIIYNKAL